VGVHYSEKNWNTGVMEYWSSGVLKKTGKETEQEANTKTRSYESTKEEGGYLNPTRIFSCFPNFVLS
jgi:hypothetical protein